MGTRKDMRNPISKTDCERVLSGYAPEGEGLDDLVSAVRVLGRFGESAPPEDEVRHFAAEAARSVSSGAKAGARLGAVRSTSGVGSNRRRKRRLRPALVATAMAVVLVMSASAGVAYAADGAVPGDTLYGLDLALEKVRIGDGGLGERLTEAGQLVRKGRPQEGLDLAGKAISESAPEDEDLLASAEALLAAAEAAVRNQRLYSQDVLEGIAEKLRMMASGEKSAEQLGRAVDDLTGSLGEAGSHGGSDDPGGPANGSGQGEDAGPGGTDSGSEVDQKDNGAAKEPPSGAGPGENDSPGGEGQPR